MNTSISELVLLCVTQNLLLSFLTSCTGMSYAKALGQCKEMKVTNTVPVHRHDKVITISFSGYTLQITAKLVQQINLLIILMKMPHLLQNIVINNTTLEEVLHHNNYQT